MLRYGILFLSILFASSFDVSAAAISAIQSDLAVLRLCNASSPVSLQAVNSVLINRDMKSSETQTQDFKCFLLCLYVEYGWMDREGGFSLHHIKLTLESSKLPEYRIKKLIYSCTATEITDPCERAFNFTECFWSHSDKETSPEAEIPEKEVSDNQNGFYYIN
ncbi:Odorant binding protein 8 [Cephus cinctus]|nr:uncharacterized protein LOC107266700 [Cephus cinctus]RLZ02184.1 Odorant binding protein 8 [Cephus cinctus]